MREQKYYVYQNVENGTHEKFLFQFEGTLKEICKELGVKLPILLNVIDTSISVKCGHFIKSQAIHEEKEIDLFTQNLEEE